MAKYAIITPNPILYQVDVRCSLLPLVPESSWWSKLQMWGSQEIMGE